MCGIVALFRRDGRPVAADEIAAMRDTLTHRGPDDAGILIDGAVGLGHRRLQIIDLASGHQPMANADGSVQLVFNGEIYNYRELRTLLLGRGVPLRTQSDSETILGLYDLFGDECVTHLRGMFAFVLWDARRRRLVAARDRLGIKPLYVATQGSTLAFASEIKALLRLGGFEARLAEDTVPEYLVFRSLAGTRTMFHGVERLAPGEMLVATAGDVVRRRYWTAPEPVAGETAAPRSLDSWAEEFECLLDTVVREHLVSDVPLGTFNSGGVDSSLVSALAAAATGAGLNTYSVGFDEPDFDERPYAQMVAARFGTTHHTLVVSEADYRDWLPRAVWHHDEPLSHPHSVHLYYLSRLARRRVTVVLTGEGSDELFAGYPRYRLAHLLDRVMPRLPLARTALRLVAPLLPDRQRVRVRSVLNGDGRVDIGALAAFVERDLVAGVLHGGIDRGVGWRPHAMGTAPAILARALAFDQQTYLQALLLRLDKMSMAASLEGRVPFLDHRVVEFAARVPPRLKLRGLETKVLVKTVARRHLPPEIIQRRKAGFAVPLGRWLRAGGPLDGFVELLLEPQARTRAYLDRARVRQLVTQHRRGERDHAEVLWGLLNLELWHREVLERAVDPRSSADHVLAAAAPS